MYNGVPGPGAFGQARKGDPGTRGTFFDLGGLFYGGNGPVECSMRWALTGSFEHSNRELLALSICRDMTVFVIHKGSITGP